ncbi:Oleosin family protein [Euphorbia peplus]|nr:Oleosin family protein [Euphorbia peplus]
MSDLRYLSQMTPRDPHPGSHPAIKSLTAGTLGAAFFIVSGLTLTATVIALIVATPVLVFFSPVLVPAAIVLFLVASGFFFSGGCGVGAIMVLTWMYNYMTGKHPLGADQIDYARSQIARRAVDMKDKAIEYGQFVQQKAQEATQT